MPLTKESFAGAKLQVLKVDAPEFGGDGHVYLRKLSVRHREDWECWVDDYQNLGASKCFEKYHGFRAFLLARTLCDESGTLLFADVDEGVNILNECAASSIDRLYDQAVAFNALDKAAVEELEGNSKGAPSGDSS